MICFKKFETAHFDLLEVQDVQKPELSEAKFIPADTFSLFDNDQILGIFGFWQITPSRYALVALIDKRSGPYMFGIVKVIKKMITAGAKQRHAERIEVFVASGFTAGAKLAKLLGFKFEGTLRKLLKGLDYDIYALIF